MLNWGAQVQLFITRSAGQFTAVPVHQLQILQQMKVPIVQAENIAGEIKTSLIIDGIIGYSLNGAPRGAAADLIRWANRQAEPVLSLDVPSGIDAGSGTIFEPAVRATATLTLALPKEGLRTPEVKAQVGELYLADISVPPALYAGPGLRLQVGPIFAESDIVRLS